MSVSTRWPKHAPRRWRVMVVTPDAALGRTLAERLPETRFALFASAPGADFVAAACRVSPHIAVLDRIERRTAAAQMEIALLKQRRPEVRIILASGASTVAEAPLVEQGIFFYFAGRPRRELARVVQAAATVLERHGGPVPER